jgi:hypothetical protein
MEGNYFPAPSFCIRHRCSPICLHQLAVYVSEGIAIPSRINLHAFVVSIDYLCFYCGRIHCIRDQDHCIAGLENKAAWNHLHHHFQWIYTFIEELKLPLLVRQRVIGALHATGLHSQDDASGECLQLAEKTISIVSENSRLLRKL